GICAYVAHRVPHRCRRASARPANCESRYGFAASKSQIEFGEAEIMETNELIGRGPRKLHAPERAETFRFFRAEWPLHHRADLPGHELEVAVAERLGFGALARGDLEHAPEDFLALGGNRHAVEEVAAVHVHVVVQAAVDLGRGGELDRGRRLAAERRAAP